MYLQLLIVATVLVGVFGGTAACLGLKAFRRNGGKSLLCASTGFALVTAGTVLGGLFVLINQSMVELYLAQSAIVAAGLFFIVHSISLAGGSAEPRKNAHR